MARPTGTLHLIGNAHIDPVWLWSWQEGYQVIKATFRSALDILRAYPEFTFTASSAAFYEWIEHSDPAMFAEIRQYVAEGRWELAGGWWIEPDCNLPCGESFARQALFGQRYFKEKFGRIASTGYAIDSFGHCGSLPQILKKSGLESYIFMRPGPHEKDLPSPVFRWQAQEGSQVLAFRITGSYATWDDQLIGQIQDSIEAIPPEVGALMCFYGVGDHGGGPTRENVETILKLQGRSAQPKLVFSTPWRFFSALRTMNLVLPVVVDDLQHHASGCYSAHSGIKRWNRRAENLLMTAEKLSVVALKVVGQPYALDFEHAWKDVLFNQFHDILAGTSLESAYADARDQLGEAMTIGSRALNAAIQALAWQVKLEPEDGAQPVIVFNPHPWPVRANVELEMGNYQPVESENQPVLLDDNNRPQPYQWVQSLALAPGRSRASFMADLPALGYQAYRFTTRTGVDQFPPLLTGHTFIENESLRLEIDPFSGTICHLYDRTTGVELIQGLAAKAVVIDDPSDTWSHFVTRFDQVVGEFIVKSIRLIESGPVKAVLRVESVYGCSTLVQDFTLYAGLPYLEAAVTVDWHEQFKLLKLRFPLNLEQAVVTYEIPYGSIVRPADGDEQPGQSWLDVSGVVAGSTRSYGVSLLNDGKYSFDVQGSDLGMTILRSPIYAFHFPAQPHPDRSYTYMDQGIQHFTYRLLPHAGDWRTGEVPRRAAELNQPPLVLASTFHPQGTLPPSSSFMSVEPGNILLTVLKQAEDGDDLILRAYETAGVATRAVIRMPAWVRTVEVDFGAYEIKTLRVSQQDASLPVVETNLLEDG
ncbi:MAG: alpha-mannosidase [Chloroflexi bacterium]|nr:alpha-mannosidase [Chloroflexota bacterium]